MEMRHRNARLNPVVKLYPTAVRFRPTDYAFTVILLLIYNPLTFTAYGPAHFQLTYGTDLSCLAG